MVDFNSDQFIDHTKQQIETKAKTILTSIGSELPIDVDLIIEKSGLDLFEARGLKRNSGIDAYLAPAIKTINFDPDVFEPRMRFSLAHEFGHYVLHKELIESSHISDFAEWKNFVENFPEWMWFKIEGHADEFAGQLLVPKEKIIEVIPEFSSQLTEVKDHGITDIDLINNNLSKLMCINFNVSNGTMWKRLKNEEINPLDYI